MLRQDRWKAVTVRAKTPCNTIILIANYDDNDELYQTHIYVREVDTLFHETISELLNEIERLRIKNAKLEKLTSLISDLMYAWDRRSCQQCLLETISRLISLCLKNKIPLSHIQEELQGMRCNASVLVSDGSNINISCPHAIYNALRRVGKKWKYGDEETKRRGETAKTD